MFPSFHVNNLLNGTFYTDKNSEERKDSTIGTTIAGLPSFEEINESFKKFPEKFRTASLVERLKKPKLSQFEGLLNQNSPCFAALHLGRRAMKTGFEGVPRSHAVGWSALALEELTQSESQDHLLKVPKSDEL